MCNRSAIHTMTVELPYKLHLILMPVSCTVNNIGLAGFFSECPSTFSVISHHINYIHFFPDGLQLIMDIIDRELVFGITQLQYTYV